MRLIRNWNSDSEQFRLYVRFVNRIDSERLDKNDNLSGQMDHVRDVLLYPMVYLIKIDWGNFVPTRYTCEYCCGPVPT